MRKCNTNTLRLYLKNDRVLLTNKYYGSALPKINTLFELSAVLEDFPTSECGHFIHSQDQEFRASSGIFIYLDNHKNVCLLRIFNDIGDFHPVLIQSNDWYIYKDKEGYICSQKAIQDRSQKYHFTNKTKI